MSIDNLIELQKVFGNREMPKPSEEGNIAIEVTDARECYLERFRWKLIDKYEQTSVSTINAGIAGENLFQMSRRLDRDVIRYLPDLVIINGALNWDNQLGDKYKYKEILSDMVQKIKENTEANIILLTPNGDVPNPLHETGRTTTIERVEVIRELAVKAQICLVDVYSIWEEAAKRGCPWEEILANGINHPGVEGHEVYAIALMKLFE